jgi:hypothetical protein
MIPMTNGYANAQRTYWNAYSGSILANARVPYALVLASLLLPTSVPEGSRNQTCSFYIFLTWCSRVQRTRVHD